MACRFALFALFALFVLSALSCSDEAASNEPESRTSTWEYNAQPGKGFAFSSWKAIPQTDNEIRLVYVCGSGLGLGKDAYLLLQFAVSPSLVTRAVKNTHVAKAFFAWGQWDNLKAIASAPPDTVYMTLFDREKHLFRIRSQALNKKADQRLQDKLRKQYELAGIGLKFYGADFKIRNEAILIDLVGASAAIEMLSHSCASN